MSIKKLLLATTSLCVLGLAPLPTSAQDAALSAAYEAYVSASSGDDAAARAAAEAAFLAECARVGTPLLDECIALVTTAPSAEESVSAEESAPTDEPAVDATPADEAAPEAPVEKTAPADEPTGVELPMESPSPADRPAADATTDPATDPALGGAYAAYVSAQSGTDDAAKADAEAALLAECNRLGLNSLEECLALLSAGGSVTVNADQPLEDIPNQEVVEAEAAPVLDSAKETADSGAEEPADVSADEVEAPGSDAEAQTEPSASEEEVTATVETEGERIEQLTLEQPEGVEIVSRTDDDRFVFRVNLQLSIFTPYDDRDRIARDGDEVYYERLDNGRVRQVVVRGDGSRVITVWNRDGELVRRVKVCPDGTRVVLIFVRDDDRRVGDRWRDPGEDLPRFRLTIPVGEYVLYSENADEDEIALFFAEPPLERAARVYSVEEVKHSARIRDTLRRVEIGDLTFDTGKATVDRDQVGSLTKVANAMLRLLDRNPGEVFLIEGHTDAVGSDESNLELSDRRAEAVARLLTDLYNVPPENLITQGYGERYLKVVTEDAERANRRATIRRITPLVASAN